MSTVTAARLSEKIFDYIAANANMTANILTVRKRYEDLGYTEEDMNIAVTELLEDGTLEMADVGFLTIASV